MSAGRNVQLIEICYYRMWNQWDKSDFEEILTPDITLRGSLGKLKRGYQGLAEYMDFVHGAFPDCTNRIDEMISEGDKSFARLSYTGAQEGEIFGVAPTHKQVKYAGSAVFRFEGEKIRDVWVLGDIYGLLQQLNDRAGS